MKSTGRGRWGGTQLYSALSQGEGAPQEALPNLTGTNVGGYQIVRELGRGGMGVVYLAEHPIIHTRVAVKILRPELARRPEIAQRFIDEARAAALIEHPNSVRIFDLTTLASGQPCIVMEFIEGWRLDELLARGKLHIDRTLTILTQICDALTAAHKRGIVHRDVKPQNVLLVNREAQHDTVKLLDFGLAKIGDDLEGSGRGALVGTPRYMAPEQIKGEHCDARTDIYAVGVLAYELLAGDVPFDGTSPEEITFKHITVDPPYIADYSPLVNAVLEKALAKAPKDRYGSALEFLHAFAEALRAVAAPASLPPLEEVTQPVTQPITKPHAIRTDINLVKPLVSNATPAFFAPPSSPPADPFTREIGPDWKERLKGTHYVFLGIPLDARDEGILAGARRWDVALSNVPEDSQEYAELRPQVQARLAEARRTLLQPARRALYDAEIRNMRGFALSLTSGLAPTRFRSLHDEFAQKFPERAYTAQRLSAQAAQLQKQGLIAHAIKLMDDALEEDPLSLGLHQQSFQLRRQLAAGGSAPLTQPLPPTPSRVSIPPPARSSSPSTPGKGREPSRK